MQQDKYDNPGTLSPSGFKKILTGGRGGEEFGKTARGYAKDVVMRMMGVESPELNTFPIRWGNENEPFAREVYEIDNVCTVEQPERIFHPEYDFISGEPDGLVGNDGIIEIKCPNSNNHFDNLISGKQIDKYMPQMQGYLWITGRQWCDFVSYDPRFPEKHQLSVYRIERDDEFILTLEEKCVKFWNEIVIPLKNKMT